MGTKNNPGKFDCYNKAEPDEPMFVLLGRDQHAAEVVRYWIYLKNGGTPVGYASAMNMATIGALKEKHREAYDCSISMEAWRSSHHV